MIKNKTSTKPTQSQPKRKQKHQNLNPTHQVINMHIGTWKWGLRDRDGVERGNACEREGADRGSRAQEERDGRPSEGKLRERAGRAELKSVRPTNYTRNPG